MNIFAIVISALALVFSIFTFYWLYLRDVKKLYLIRIDNLNPEMRPEFAIVNGGKKDILITDLHCGFETADGKGATYPAQEIRYSENNSLLLAAGKSFHCKVFFKKAVTQDIVEDAEVDNASTPAIYKKQLRINISWVEPNGDTYNKSVNNICKYGFRESGDMCIYQPLQQKHDLHFATERH